MKNSLPAAPGGRVIVLDTAALITGSDNLYALGGLIDTNTGEYLTSPSADEQVTFYTVPDVITEVRDKRARARLSLLDGAIIVRPPSSEALAAVINFAKATGDFAVLSMTDLKVMALCWMLELERNGGRRLKDSPERVLVNEVRCGRLIPFDEVDKMEREAGEAEERVSGDDDDWQVVEGKADGGHNESNPVEDDERVEPVVEENGKTERKRRRRRRRKKPVAPEGEKETPEVHMRNELPDEEVNRDGVSSGVHDGSESTVDKALPDQEISVNGVRMDLHEMNIGEEGQNVPNEEANQQDDDEEGWINTDNLAEHLAREGGEEEQTQEDHDRIGCVTTDFAMQNTMLQMGLKVLSVDGRRAIRKIKHFALRCHTCGTVTTENDRVFCYRCGNATMHRVAFKVDKNGVARSYLNPKKKPILRGTKYPIPMPRGGRHNRDLILCEDQIDPVKQKRLQKQKERMNVDVLDPSNFYNAGAKFDPNNRPMVVGYGRRNPNEVRRTSRRKR